MRAPSSVCPQALHGFTAAGAPPRSSEVLRRRSCGTSRALRASVLALLVMLAGCLESMFLYPDDRTYTTPAGLGLAFDEVFIPGPEGARLHGWLLRARGTRHGAVLHVHGNAANISNHLPLVAWLPAAGYDVLLFDYRGFGKSDGKPSLEGIVADTRAALQWLRERQGERQGAGANAIAVIGNSIGGATALRAVAAEPAGVRLVVVDSAFASYRGIARDAAGVLRPIVAPLIATLPPSASDPVEAIRDLRVPLLVMHGDADRVIPIAHGEALFAAANDPKRWLRIAGGAHLDALTRAPVQRVVLEMLEQTKTGAP